MTKERLKKYRKYKRQLDNPYGLSSDTKKQLALEIKEIEEYIKSIDDLETKSIFEKHFIFGISYTKLSLQLKCDEKTLRRQVERYLESRR